MKLNRIRSFLVSVQSKKVGAFALAIALAFCLIAPPKAYAVAGTTAAAGSAALAAYLQAGGVFLVVDSGGAAAASSAVTSLTSKAIAAGYLTGFTSAESALSAITAGLTVSTGGAVLLTAAAAAICAGVYAYASAQLPDVGDVDIAYSSHQMGDLIVSGFVGDYNSTLREYELMISQPGTAFTAVGQRVFVGNGIFLELQELSNNIAIFRFVDANGNGVPYWNGDKYITNMQFWFGRTNNSGSTAVGDLIVDNVHPLYIVDGTSTNTYTFAGYWDGVDAYLRPQRTGTSSTLRTYFYPSLFNSALIVNQSIVNAENRNGLVDIPAPSGSQQLQFPGLLAPGQTSDNLYDAIFDPIAGDDLQLNDPNILNPAPPPTIVIPPDPGFNPDLPDTGDVTEPTNPGTDSPFLPDTLDIPWHYVNTTISYALAFIPVAMAAFSNFLPTSCQIVIWAAVVLAVVFGLLRRFLG